MEKLHNEYEGMDIQNSEFWINQLSNGKEIITSNLKSHKSKYHNLNEDFIKFYSDKNQDHIEALNLKKIIRENSIFASYNYVHKDSSRVDKKELSEIEANLNIESIVEGENYNIKYGFCIRRSPIRLFPSDEFLCREGDELKFDRFSESAIYTFENFIELFISRDKKWSFILTEFYSGWVKSEDLVYCSYDKWKEYMDSEDFLIVKSSQTSINYHGKSYILHMGTKVKLLDYKEKKAYISIPIKADEKGNSLFVKVARDNISDFSRGYLDYNQHNILDLAFKMLGEGYGWGSSFNMRDCSSFVQDIYKCFGIKIHRNSKDQWEKSYGKAFDMTGMTEFERINLLNEIPLASPIYKEGHVMIYIGKYKEDFYMIHNAASIHELDGDLKVFEDRVMKVLLSPFSIRNSKGEKFINLTQGAKVFY